MDQCCLSVLTYECRLCVHIDDAFHNNHININSNSCFSDAVIIHFIQLYEGHHKFETDSYRHNHDVDNLHNEFAHSSVGVEKAVTDCVFALEDKDSKMLLYMSRTIRVK